MAEPISMPVPTPEAEPPELEASEFPGCRPMWIPRDEIDSYEGRIEYWERDTEIAMVCEPPVSYYHERPSHGLAQLVGLIAAARGAPIVAAGSVGIFASGERGETRRVLQADQTLFVHPERAIRHGRAIDVDVDTLPDVVLEVDNTTDVRRGKLGLYESWGLPEVWVEVPDRPDPSRPASLRPGLTIHVLAPAGFRAASESRAFQGLTAVEIHQALNETSLSDETAEVLERVGRALGAVDGAVPDDDPFLRRQRRESRLEGRIEGHDEGYAEGRKQGAIEAALQIVSARGVVSSASLARRLAAMETFSAAALTRAALQCRDEDDLLRRLFEQR